MLGGSIKFLQVQKPTNVAASAAVQFKQITVMATVIADWLTNHTELNTNTNNYTIVIQSQQPNTNKSAHNQD